MRICSPYHHVLIATRNCLQQMRFILPDHKFDGNPIACIPALLCLVRLQPKLNINMYYNPTTVLMKRTRVVFISPQISIHKRLERVHMHYAHISNFVCDTMIHFFFADLQRLRVTPIATSTPIRHNKTTAKVAKAAEMAMRMEESIVRTELRLVEMETHHRERSNVLTELMQFKTAQLLISSELRRMKREVEK